MRAAADIRGAILARIDARLGGARTQAGEPIVDLVDAVAAEQEATGALCDYALLGKTPSGWSQITSDETLKQRLAAALGISYATADAKFARRIGAPAGLASDVEALLWVDLGRLAAAYGRARRPARFASVVVRAYLASNAPATILRGGVVRADRTGILYDSQADVVAQAPSLDVAVGAYYVDLAVRARTAGLPGNAVAGSISAIVSGLPNVVAVTNQAAADGGAGAESNADLVAALLDAGSVGSIETPSGLREFARSVEGVVDALVVGPGDPLMERAAAGAVDLYLLGSDLKTRVDVLRVLAEGETVVLPVQPVVAISSVTAGSPLTEGNAFVSTPDAGLYAGSARARTSVTWKTVAEGGPAADTDVTVTYSYDDLVRSVQRRLDGDPDVSVPGASVLAKRATRVGVSASMVFVPLPVDGVSADDVQAAIEAAVQAAIDAQPLGAGLDYSDLLVAAATAKVDNVPVVDKIDGFVFGRSGSALGTADLAVEKNEYVRTDAVNAAL